MFCQLKMGSPAKTIKLYLKSKSFPTSEGAVDDMDSSSDLVGRGVGVGKQASHLRNIEAERNEDGLPWEDCRYPAFCERMIGTGSQQSPSRSRQYKDRGPRNGRQRWLLRR